MTEKSWNPRKIPTFKKGLDLLLEYESEFSKHYLNVLNECLRNNDHDFCTKEDSRDKIGYDPYTYIKDKHNSKKYNKIKKELEININNKNPIYRAISTCHFDEFRKDLEKYGKSKRVIKEKLHREEYVDIGKYWSWNLNNAFPHWGPEKCYGKQKEPIHATITGKVPYPASIDLPETFASNMLFGSDEEEITLKEGRVIKIEKLCAYPQRHKGEKIKKPSRCKIINKYVRI